MKKIISLFLSFVLMVTACFAYTGYAYAGDINFGDGITGVFDESTETLTVSGASQGVRMPDFDINKTFDNIEKVKTIKVESAVDKIGMYAFYNCQNLEKIIIYNTGCEISVNALPANKDIVIYGSIGSSALSYATDNGYQTGNLYYISFTCMDGRTLSAQYPENTPASEIVQPDFTVGYTHTGALTGNHQHTYSAQRWNRPVADVTKMAVYTESRITEECSFIDTVVPADCMTGSYIHHECEFCGYTYDDDPTGELGDHEYAELPETRIEPSCQDTGSVEMECEICGDVKTEILPVVDHSYTGTAVSNDDHTHNAYCKYDCGEFTVEGCTFASEVINPPTKLEEGETKYTCTKCGYIYYDTIDKVDCNHTGETEIKNAKPESCTEKGYTGDTYCKECNTLIKSGTSIDMKDHDYVEVAEAIEAKCTEDGKTAVMRCSVCDYETGGDVILKTGHNYVEISAKVNPSCTTDGKAAVMQCSNCGDETGGDVILKTGHNYVEISAKVNPSCTADGRTAFLKCSNCGDEIGGVIIPKTDHDFGIDGKNEKCSVCAEKNPNYVEPSGIITVPITAYPTTAYSEQPTSKKSTPAPKKPGKTSIKKLQKGKKSFKVTWKKVSSVSGYQIQYSTDKKFKKNKKTVTIKGNKAKTPSKTIKGLKSKKTYYVRVRAYKNVKVNGVTKKVYSASWSKVKSVKTK